MSGSKDIPSAASNSLLGVLLAGGRSRRMGTDKASLPLGGKSLASHMVCLLERSGVVEVAISGSLPGVESIPDEQPLRGPLMGILSAARQKAIRNGSLLIVPVDMPGLSEAVLTGLVAWVASDENAVHYEGYELPMLLRWNPKTHSVLRDLLREGRSARDSSLHNLLAALDAKRLTVPPGEERRFLNLNTAEDWSVFQEDLLKVSGTDGLR